MPMEMVFRLKNLKEPSKSLDPMMGQVFLIMDPPWRRVGDKDIQVTTRFDPGY
jgi:hypothetical protein